MRRSRHTSGFTMIEMAVTMTVFAILVALGVPAMNTWIKNNKVRTVTDSLQTGLRLAQAESLRRSRQVVFALTNSTTPTLIPLPAVAGGTSWAIWTLPSMTNAADETPTFIQSGVLTSAASSQVTIATTGNVSTVCFNSMGRLVNNASANVIAITGGDACVQPTAGAPPVLTFNIALAGADRPLQVNLGLGGQVHMCDPNVAISDAHPEGCP
ncbi:MAG TPA: GspH/FimT family pseudopilin [Steroidobacteraceae bacterium]|jgi:type IV fimbrial biogenesis protein FimT|nr:GspH/FimT family pseudopilin [Steroidobacteraceae bacterium]